MTRLILDDLVRGGRKMDRGTWQEYLRDNIRRLLTTEYPHTGDFLEALPDRLCDEICDTFVAYFLTILDRNDMVSDTLGEEDV